MKRTRSNSYGKKKAPPAKTKKYSKRFPRELSNDRVHFVKRHAGLAALTISNTAFTLTAYQFNLNQIPLTSNFTNLYDQYRICGIKVTFYPPVTQVSTITTINTPTAAARMFSAIDLNDNTPPASTDEIREYENCKINPITEKHVRYIPFPKFINSSGQNVNDWISSSNPGTAHYGLKVAVEPMGSTSTLSMNYNVEACFYLCFKNIK